MGLFGKKKKKVEFPPLPELPKGEGGEGGLPEFPAYEPSISEIKEGVGKAEAELPGKGEFEIPKREKGIKGKKLAAARVPGVGAGVGAEEEREEGEEKPLYIKVEQYKAALEDLEALKAKIAEADAIISELEDLKAQEDKKLEDWKADIQNLKDRLLSIDENLFEA